MINKNISIHLQDFPDVSFLNDEKDLVANMDLVRSVCSTALAIRDNKKLRVRLPLNSLKVIGKDSQKILDFKDIIADEINVKNIEVAEDFSDLADLKLQINFKKIGSKLGPKIKEITTAIKEGNWTKISETEVEVAGVNLKDDDFELKLAIKDYDQEKYAIQPLSTNDYLISLDIEITKELEDEGIARDIIRAIQQNRKDADLDISHHINVKIFCQDSKIAKVVNSFNSYIKEQVLADNLNISEESKVKKQKFSYENKLDDGKILVGF
jgi:isoleucyl-tRNA synthetase